MDRIDRGPILRFLKSLPHDETLYYFPNPGNAGDAMIALAAFQLFAQAGLKHRVVPRSSGFDPSGRIVIYAGGGNLVEYYDTARKAILACYPHLERLIILPHTIQANEGLLAGFRDNVDVICREPVSYRHVKQHAPRANAYLMDDLAFHLDAGALLAGRPPARDSVPLSWKLRDSLFDALLPVRLALGGGSRSGGRGSLNAFRKDGESTGRFPQRDSVDLATLFRHRADSEAAARYGTVRLLKALDRYETIRTDRLHICIAGALLGKQVELFANSYFKCEAVYRYSIRDRYPNVRWMD